MTVVTDLAMEDLKERIKSKGSQKAVADELELTPAHLSDILSGKRNLSDNVLAKLGFERVSVNVKTRDAQRLIRAIEAVLEKKEPPSPTEKKSDALSTSKRNAEPVAA